MWGLNSKQDQSKYLPVPKEVAFSALVDVIKSNFNLKEVDDFSLSIVFSSGMSAFTWGENFSAQVRPQDGGSILEISGVGKVGGQVQQSTRTNKLINQIFSEVIAKLKSSSGSDSSHT
jgi:carbon monoxide dehydrogenase subunit G